MSAAAHSAWQPAAHSCRLSARQWVHLPSTREDAPQSSAAELHMPRPPQHPKSNTSTAEHGPCQLSVQPPLVWLHAPSIGHGSCPQSHLKHLPATQGTQTAAISSPGPSSQLVSPPPCMLHGYEQTQRLPRVIPPHPVAVQDAAAPATCASGSCSQLLCDL